MCPEGEEVDRKTELEGQLDELVVHYPPARRLAFVVGRVSPMFFWDQLLALTIVFLQQVMKRLTLFAPKLVMVSHQLHEIAQATEPLLRMEWFGRRVQLSTSLINHI